MTAELIIRTVTGDVLPPLLGRVNYHEHLFQVSPLLRGDELDDEAASMAEAGSLRSSGFDAVVDATPIGLHRDPEALARISLATGLSIVATTGAHREAHYAASHWLRATDERARTELFLRDLTVGMPVNDEGSADARGAESTVPLACTPEGSPVRAGLIKAGIGYWAISAFERVTVDAVASAHRETGAPVMVHLEFCTAAHEVLDLLQAGGVAPDRVVLAHADRDPNPALHLELAGRGAWLGYDGMARPRTRSDAELIDLTAVVVDGGAAGRILLGGDVARSSRYLAYGGMPGLGYLGERYLPLLRDRVGTDTVDQMVCTNPAAFLSWHSR